MSTQREHELALDRLDHLSQRVAERLLALQQMRIEAAMELQEADQLEERLTSLAGDIQRQQRILDAVGEASSAVRRACWMPSADMQEAA